MCSVVYGVICMYVQNNCEQPALLTLAKLASENPHRNAHVHVFECIRQVELESVGGRRVKAIDHVASRRPSASMALKLLQNQPVNQNKANSITLSKHGKQKIEYDRAYAQMFLYKRTLFVLIHCWSNLRFCRTRKLQQSWKKESQALNVSFLIFFKFKVILYW